MVIIMALEAMIEELQASSKDQTMPFTPAARIMMKEMLDAAQSAKEKMVKISGAVIPPATEYKEGDEKEFFTKES